MCSVQELGQHCKFPYVCPEGSALYALSHFDSFKLSAKSLDLYGAHESNNTGFVYQIGRQKDT